MECNNGIWSSIIVLGFIILLFTDDHWGPGVRGILNSIACRIHCTHEGTHATQAVARGTGRDWLRWVIGVGVAVPAAIYFAIQIYEKLA